LVRDHNPGTKPLCIDAQDEIMPQLRPIRRGLMKSI